MFSAANLQNLSMIFSAGNLSVFGGISYWEYSWISG